MSTVLCLMRFGNGRVTATNRDGTFNITLPRLHHAEKIFPPGKAVVWARCTVKDGKVTVLSPCKAKEWGNAPGKGKEAQNGTPA